MIRLYVVVEGQTEASFVDHVLVPHLANYQVFAETTIVSTSRDRRTGKKTGRGGGNFGKWERDLHNLLRSQPGSDARFTTLFDLYGLPLGFPGLAEHGSVTDTRKRAELLEAAMSAHFGDRRLVPYLQRHEFEALVLAGLDLLRELLDAPEDIEGFARLMASVGALMPEDVDDGPQSAPSKRLQQHIPSYHKTVHGPLVAEGTGLQLLRERCPRFAAWLTRLETLETST